MDPIEPDLIRVGPLGITLCPGRRDRGRDLGTDLTQLRSDGATQLPYLLTDSELIWAGVPDIGPEPRPPAEQPGRSAHPSGRLLPLARIPRTGEHEPMEEVQRLLDQLVAAGAPGAAAWIHDQHGSVQAASGVADLRGRCVFGPLGLRDTLLPGNSPGIPSPTSRGYSLPLAAHAQPLARDFNATLVPVLAWLPPDGDLADRRTTCEELCQIWPQDARQRLQDALNLAWGTPPADLPVRPLVRPARRRPDRRSRLPPRRPAGGGVGRRGGLMLAPGVILLVHGTGASVHGGSAGGIQGPVIRAKGGYSRGIRGR